MPLRQIVHGGSGLCAHGCRFLLHAIVTTQHILAASDVLFLAIAGNTEDNESFAILGEVAVVDDLATERKMATRMLATGGSRSQVAKLNSRWRRNKKWRTKLAALPEVIEVTAPAVGTVPQCTVRMPSEARQHKPGFAPVCMDITGESLTWLASTIE